MKQVSILTTTLLSLLWNISFGQVSGRINGEILDKDKHPIGAASVSLLQSKDSSIVKTVATGKDGFYEFGNLGLSSYLVMASTVGYTNVYSKVITISATLPTQKLSPLEMKEDTKRLAP
jgi:hypothetical protein